MCMVNPVCPMFSGYFQVVVEALHEKTGSNDCLNQVIEAHRQIVNMILKNQSQIVEKSFR